MTFCSTINWVILVYLAPLMKVPKLNTPKITMPKSTIVNGNEPNTQVQKTITGMKRLHSLTRFTMQVNVRGKYVIYLFSYSYILFLKQK